MTLEYVWEIKIVHSYLPLLLPILTDCCCQAEIRKQKEKNVNIMTKKDEVYKPIVSPSLFVGTSRKILHHLDAP